MNDRSEIELALEYLALRTARNDVTVRTWLKWRRWQRQMCAACATAILALTNWSKHFR